MDITLLAEASKKTRQLRTQFGVQCLSIFIKHFAEPFLQFRKALRWCAWCTYPWLDSLAHMWFKPIVHSPQINEASTVHLCAVCLFLLIFRWVEIILSPSSMFLRFILFTCAWIFHRQSLCFKKISSRGPYFSASTRKISSGGPFLSWQGWQSTVYALQH